MSQEFAGSGCMPENLPTRRTVFVGAAGVALGAGLNAGEFALAQPGRRSALMAPAFGAAEILPDDPRYSYFQSSINNRFVGHPDIVKLVRNSDDAVRGLQKAVERGVGVGVRSGGHCAADFIAHDGIRTLFDLSPLNIVDFDPEHDAYVVGAGARLYEVLDSLYRNYRVTLPGGVCHSVGMGGMWREADTDFSPANLVSL